MIERHWKGICKTEGADDYREHLLHDTFEILREISGFKGAKILTRNLHDGVEFLIITIWDSLEDIKKFAGEHAEIAVVPDVVKDMMLRYEATAVHYEVVVNI